MEKEMTLFRKLPTREAAEDLRQLLLQNDIEAVVSGDDNEFEHLYMGSLQKPFYEVQIASSDFPKATRILENAEKEEVETVDKDYYLYEYSNKELWEIIEKYDEWSTFDFQLAQKILRERGETVDDATINSLKYKRLDTLVQPEKVATIWIIVAYVSAFLGGIFGVLFGYTIMKSTKTLPDGNKVYTYTPEDRAHGKTIFYIGLIIVPISIISIVVSGYWKS